MTPQDQIQAAKEAIANITRIRKEILSGGPKQVHTHSYTLETLREEQTFLEKTYGLR